MIVSIRYGKELLEVEVPEEAAIIEGVAADPVTDPESTLLELIDNPLGSPSLKDILARHDKPAVCVAVSDKTRPVPYRAILPTLLGYLRRHGVPKENITILIATGMHRASTEDERREMFGDIVEEYKIVDHDARDESAMIPLPERTKSGTAVSVNRLFFESDINSSFYPSSPARLARAAARMAMGTRLGEQLT